MDEVHNALTDALQKFCESEGLPLMSADELMFELDNDHPRYSSRFLWLYQFVKLWNTTKSFEFISWS